MRTTRPLDATVAAVSAEHYLGLATAARAHDGRRATRAARELVRRGETGTDAALERIEKGALG